MDRSNGDEKAIASLVLGIISIVSIFFGLSLIGLICGIIAIILGNRARREGGGGIATAGFVCGIIGTSFCALIFYPKHFARAHYLWKLQYVSGLVYLSLRKVCNICVRPLAEIARLGLRHSRGLGALGVYVFQLVAVKRHAGILG